MKDVEDDNLRYAMSIWMGCRQFEQRRQPCNMAKAKVEVIAHRWDQGDGGCSLGQCGCMDCRNFERLLPGSCCSYELPLE